MSRDRKSRVLPANENVEMKPLARLRSDQTELHFHNSSEEPLVEVDVVGVVSANSPNHAANENSTCDTEADKAPVGEVAPAHESVPRYSLVGILAKRLAAKRGDAVDVHVVSVAVGVSAPSVSDEAHGGELRNPGSDLSGLKPECAGQFVGSEITTIQSSETAEAKGLIEASGFARCFLGRASTLFEAGRVGVTAPTKKV